MSNTLTSKVSGRMSSRGWAIALGIGAVALAAILLVVYLDRYRARVSDSWILRWLSGMVNDAVGSFRDGAEREADRYHRACLLALRDDLAALDAAP